MKWSENESNSQKQNVKSQKQHLKEITQNAKREKNENVPNMKRMRNERNLTMTEIALGIRFVTPSKICQKIAEMRQNYRGKNPGEFVMSPARTRYRIPDKLKIQGKGKRTLKSAKIAEMRQNCRGQTRADLL